MMEEIKELIFKFALLNAVEHGGNAKVKPVIGRLMAERPDLRPEIKELIPIIKEVVEEVNKMRLEERKRIVEEKWPEELAETEVKTEKKLPPLPNVEKYKRVITRFAPNPDCVLHLGSARAIILSYEYAKMYNGLFYLRFEDTDPRTKRPALEFYDAIREDLLWLGCKWDAEYIQSDRLLIYYKYAERLISEGKAYVCTCSREYFSERIKYAKPCPCRNLPPETHLERWYGMLNGTYREGEAVVRIKTDLTHPNPAVRDWAALRIIDPEKYPHPRPEIGSKYRVWPLYNFACGLDDHLMGVTHIIRGKEHISNEIKQRYLYYHLGWNYPETIHYGRLKVVGAILSKSKIVEGLKSGIYSSWDDIKLATFAALRRRGITPEAIRKLILDIGPKTADLTISWENLYAYNRKIIDAKANRYFFVPKPRLLKIHKCKPMKIKLPLHPEHKEKGYRELEVKTKNETAEVWISEYDAEKLKVGSIFRLIGLFNVEITKTGEVLEAKIHSLGHEDARKLKLPLVQWVPNENKINLEVVRPDGVDSGYAEENLIRENAGSLIQLVRYGFGRVDRKREDKVVIYYAHP